MGWGLPMPKKEEIKPGDVWFVNFPLEEDESTCLQRPVVVAKVESAEIEVLSIKLTKSKPRGSDRFDFPIKNWANANLYFQTTARVSKVMLLNKRSFIFKIGSLDPEDFTDLLKLLMEFFDSIN